MRIFTYIPAKAGTFNNHICRTLNITERFSCLWVPSLAALTIMVLSAATRAETFEQIIVTANLTPTPLAQVGSSVTVLEGATLDALGNPVATDFLRQVPSLSVSRYGGVGTLSQIRIRGAEARQTLVYIDGIKANDPASGSEFGFAELLSDGIGRVEIVRGPQSALYGSEAIGGVINIMTKKQANFLSVDGGSFGTAHMSGGASLNTPHSDLSLLGSYYRTDGIAISKGSALKDGARNLTFQAKGALHPTDEGELGATVRVVGLTSQTNPDPTDPLKTDLRAETKAVRFYSRGYATINLLDYHWQTTLSGAYVSTRNRNYDSLLQLTNTDFGTRFVVNANSSLKQTWGATRHEFVVGLENSREGFHELAESVYVVQGYVSQVQARTQKSVIGQYRLGIADRLFADASIRQDWNGGARDPQNNFRNALTWRVSGSGIVGAGVRIHGSAGRGVTDPTFVDQFGFYPSSFVGNPNLKPENSTGFDGGLEWHNGNTLIDVTYFKTNLKDAITADYSQYPLISVKNQPGTSKRQGIEISATTKVGPVKLSGFYSYGKYRNSQNVEEFKRPQHEASLTASSALTAAMNVAASASYTGRQTDIFFDPVSFNQSVVSLKNYVLVTLSAHYNITKKLALTGRLENAFNQKYQDVFRYQTPGIGAYVGVKYIFNEEQKK